MPGMATDADVLALVAMSPISTSVPLTPGRGGRRTRRIEPADGRPDRSRVPGRATDRQLAGVDVSPLRRRRVRCSPKPTQPARAQTRRPRPAGWPMPNAESARAGLMPQVAAQAAFDFSGTQLQRPRLGVDRRRRAALDFLDRRRRTARGSRAASRARSRARRRGRRRARAASTSRS